MKSLMTSLLLVVLTASIAVAQCPDSVGMWSTSFGTMLGGRASEAYCAVYPYPAMGGVPGNTQNAMSFDGAALGTQWKAYGMAIDATGAVQTGQTGDPDNGYGTRTYQTSYEGGQFWLSKDYSWADGLADLTGDLMSFLVITTITYIGGDPVGASSNISFEGLFDNCDAANDCRIEFAIANALLAWSPAYPVTMPTGYPPFLCGAATGELFDVCCITVTILCEVPNEPTTWSGLKNLYR